MKVSVGIKALNEERHIEAAIVSALAAIEGLDGEVILADSGSSDRTIEIARAFPIRIVQFANSAERCCGAGAQLAYQHARGAYFYILDGDMVLDPGFLKAGIAYLEAHPDLAAVGGIVREMNTQAAEFEIRARAVARDGAWKPGPVDRLDCGGLYRTQAIREVGWFADRNLHAFEEFELGARLHAKGWRLARIDHKSVDHYGHRADGYALLLRRFGSGYAGAPGEVVRGALGRPHFGHVMRHLSHVRIALLVSVWWIALLTAVATGAWLSLLGLIVAPFLFLSWRRGSLRLGLFSLASWNVGALAFYSGLLRARVSPETPRDAARPDRAPAAAT
ncbi:glycosyl transferase, partial [Amaricoccus sp. HAR-UPW-R2A-40]